MTKPASYTDPTVVADLTAAAAANGGSDFKALVCLFLFGGNDAHNTVMPLTGANRVAYDTFRANQTNVGIPIGQAPTNHLNADWRLHHNLNDLKTLWDAGKVATIMNVGPLIEPTNRDSYNARSVKLPDQLFSHNSQQQQWQKLPPYRAVYTHGWMGRAHDLAAAYYNPSALSGVTAVLSVAGTQVQMIGYEAKLTGLEASQTTPVARFTAGVNYTGSSITTGDPSPIRQSRERHDWDNKLQEYMAANNLQAFLQTEALNTNLQALPAGAATIYGTPANGLPSALFTAARLIQSAATFGHRRQLIFVSLGGFDNHSSLRTNHDALMNTVDDAIATFRSAMVSMGFDNNVVLFTESDFGRTLVQNGSLGSDHGWGGHHFAVGGPVIGGMYGPPVDLTVNSIMDAGQGRLIPQLACEQYVGTLLKWWGIPEQHLPLVLPNIGAYTPRVLGFL